MNSHPSRLPSDLSPSRPLVMGIVNLTPDSFSGDGVLASRSSSGDVSAERPRTGLERAVAHAWAQIEAGADILDLGAESTRPGAAPTPEDEELRRLLPVLEALSGCGVPLSVDTYKPAVMKAALAAGAAMINDIRAFCAPGAIEAVADSDCALCLMHMQGSPQTMQEAPRYHDVVDEMRDFFTARVAALAAAGIAHERLILDPGFGFGKTREHNLALLARLDSLRVAGLPLLAGLSRKSLLGELTGRPVTERLAASVTAAVLAVERGAAIVRVHDVAATRDALTVYAAVRNAEAGTQVENVRFSARFP